ncbi:MAG: hypothetical protein ACRC8F_10910 [Cetobacterium sp.]|uniref:hypothetical protein n=1 Tax=Cetobacterium sp. TaxID=2071632 RepID=UPI003F3BBE29
MKPQMRKWDEVSDKEFIPGDEIIQSLVDEVRYYYCSFSCWNDYRYQNGWKILFNF